MGGSLQRSALVLLGAGAVAVLPGCERGPTLEADLAAIEEVNAQTLRALNEGDLELLNAMTAENHVMMIPNRPEIVGKEAIVAANRNLVESWDNVEIWTPAETIVAGDWAYQRGGYDITLTPKREGVAPIRSIGKYMHIYQRQEDGSWRMIRDIFNSNGPE
jgi:ketosteroid isomerase-like protein